jgi:lipoate-protein ligase A
MVAMPPTVSFGRLDSHAAGFGEAVRAASERGFAPVHRQAGGRAAAYHEGTLVFAWVVGGEDPPRGTHERFGLLGGLVVEALRGLGLDAHVAELPGEYCPGTYSIRVGAAKVSGLAQRITKAASSTEGMIVVSGGDRVRDVLVPVYGALGLDWDPATAGDCGGPGVRDVAAAVTARLARDHDLDVHPELDAETLALARRYAGRHDATNARPPERLLSPAR